MRNQSNIKTRIAFQCVWVLFTLFFSVTIGKMLAGEDYQRFNVRMPESLL